MLSKFYSEFGEICRPPTKVREYCSYPGLGVSPLSFAYLNTYTITDTVLKLLAGVPSGSLSGRVAVSETLGES